MASLMCLKLMMPSVLERRRFGGLGRYGQPTIPPNTRSFCGWPLSGSFRHMIAFFFSMLILDVDYVGWSLKPTITFSSIAPMLMTFGAWCGLSFGSLMRLPRFRVPCVGSEDMLAVIAVSLGLECMLSRLRSTISGVPGMLVFLRTTSSRLRLWLD